jgi:hypothetical protein
LIDLDLGRFWFDCLNLSNIVMIQLWTSWKGNNEYHERT